MARRLRGGRVDVVGYDRDSGVTGELSKESGMLAASSIEDLVGQLDAPRGIWLMLPAGDITEQAIAQLADLLSAGDVIVDGANSNFNDSMRRSMELRARGISFIDAGVSGGIWGLQEGYALMVGGEASAVDQLRPALEVLAPAPDRGWMHCGPAGSGHYVKMVHNGIEYGLMQAYAEGLAIMEAKEEFGLDLHQIAEIWRHGSVVRSWLLDLTAEALKENPAMEGIAPFVPDSGEGRWTVFEAIDLNVAAPIITNSLFRRISSRDEEEYADRVLSAMRNKFGGHSIKGEDG
jgi:6-phosphogluconate dehydrogenase